jgi:CRISPR-associated endonuclease/helicase Cas3
MRSAIERQLDATLRRSEPLAVFEQPSVRHALDGSEEADQAFVVLASPVEEVGRDHDCDWAIVEPSSMRSIIQLAGRVRRHRPGACSSPNIYLLGRNIKALTGVQPAFCRPGFESKEFPLESHTLEELLTDEQLAVLDAGPRIRERESLQPRANLVDLEHQRLRRLMLGEGVTRTDYAVPHWWTTRAPLTGVLQRSQPFRSGPMDVGYALVPDEDGESSLNFYQCDGWTPQGNLYREVSLSLGPRIQAWGPANFHDELAWLAEQLDLDLRPCAQRFGTVQLKPEPQGWTYHPTLGFRRQA